MTYENGTYTHETRFNNDALLYYNKVPLCLND